MKDGVRLAATLYRPDAPTAGPPAGRLRVPAVSQGRRHASPGTTASTPTWSRTATSARAWTCAARAAARGASPEREYSEQEQQDGVEVDRVARAPAVVQRQRRDVGMVVGRLQRDPDRRAAPAGAEGHPARPRRPRTSSRTTSTTSTASSTSTSTSCRWKCSRRSRAFRTFRSTRRASPSASTTPPWSLLYKKQQRDGPFWQVVAVPGAVRRDRGAGADDRRLVRRLPRLDPAHAREAEGARPGRSSGPGTTRAPTRAGPVPRSSGGARPCGSSTSS